MRPGSRGGDTSNDTPQRQRRGRGGLPQYSRCAADRRAADAQLFERLHRPFPAVDREESNEHRPSAQPGAYRGRG